jgi:hypothetical protein
MLIIIFMVSQRLVNGEVAVLRKYVSLPNVYLLVAAGAIIGSQLFWFLAMYVVYKAKNKYVEQWRV